MSAYLFFQKSLTLLIGLQWLPQRGEGSVGSFESQERRIGDCEGQSPWMVETQALLCCWSLRRRQTSEGMVAWYVQGDGVLDLESKILLPEQARNSEGISNLK